MTSIYLEGEVTICQIKFLSQYHNSRWCSSAIGRALDNRSRVQILLEGTLRNNLWQVVHAYVPLSPSSITWSRPKGSDALRLGR